eukprot:CFRG7470T1
MLNMRVSSLFQRFSRASRTVTYTQLQQLPHVQTQQLLLSRVPESFKFYTTLCLHGLQGRRHYTNTSTQESHRAGSDNRKGEYEEEYSYYASLWEETWIMLWAGSQTLLCFWALQLFVIIMPLSGDSMLPYYNNRDVWLVDKRGRFERSPERGEVLMFQSVTEPGNCVVKRVIATGGEIISCNCKVKSGEFCQGQRMHKVPKNHVWVEGDNEHNSKDSRDYGPIPEGLIVGRLMYRIWPIHLWGFPQ